MNELPRADELDNDFVEHRSRAAQQVGVEAVERELTGETTDTVEVAVYVRGRMIHTRTDAATVQRIMAILTGLSE